MRNESPSLLPIMRSRTLGELLAWLLIHPDCEYSVSELSRVVGVKLTTAQRDVGHLVEARLVTTRAVGRNRMVQADQGHPAFEPLSRVMELTFGPAAVVAETFAGLKADAVLIFGSWAARYHGQPGPPPNDIDVLVVGQPPRVEVYAAADAAQDKIGLPVNPVVRSAAQWEASQDKLVAQIRRSPLVVVLGDVILGDSKL
ncbi:MAG: ArsR family transcriptional regulator [Propionibacteriaceae bacterium]|jgi:predicted nucleotidyltransferase|nr:ArsR family transcriptional regulator [Propionibacteriaceae bacterium]